MDHEQRTDAANRHDPIAAARIVRRIADIEKDFGLAYGPLSEDLSREIVKAMGKAIADPWMFFEGNWAATILLANWRSARGVNQMDAYLEFGQVAAEDYDAATWIGAAVGSGPARLGLELKVRRGLLELAQKAFGNASRIKGLLNAGFVRDQANERLYLPIDISAEALAMGFEQNDLVEAVAPAARAVELAMAAHAELDAFVESLRADAKRK